MSIQWPLNSVSVTGEFGNSPWFYEQFGQRGHNGIDLAASVGTPVYAADSGTIAFEGWGQNHSWMGSIAGISVIIGHAWGYTGYAHLSSTVVNAGQWVERGQLIGYSGATGVGTGPHLHFEAFPLYPAFGNGYAGRINPRTLGLVPRQAPAPKPKPKPVEVEPMMIPYDVPEYNPGTVCKPGRWTQIPVNRKGDVTVAFAGAKRREGTLFAAVVASGGAFEARYVYDTISADGKRVTKTLGSVIIPSENGRAVWSWPFALPAKKRGAEQRIRIHVRPVGGKQVKVSAIVTRARFQEK